MRTHNQHPNHHIAVGLASTAAAVRMKPKISSVFNGVQAPLNPNHIVILGMRVAISKRGVITCYNGDGRSAGTVGGYVNE